jgi:hypothetical protein
MKQQTIIILAALAIAFYMVTRSKTEITEKSKGGCGCGGMA